MLESKTFRVWFGTTLLMCASFCGEVLSAQEKLRSIAPADVEYRITNTDVLLISVYQHPEFSRTVVVRPDGSITLPWCNAVKVLGLSASTVAVLLHDKLESMVPNPQVSVTVKIHGLPPVPLRREQSPRDIPAPGVLQGCCVAKIDAVAKAMS
jgi:protein involved in polysaccharide export with SLBB domain